MSRSIHAYAQKRVYGYIYIVGDLILQNCRLDVGGAPPQPNVNVGEPQYGGVSLLQQMVAGTGGQYIYFYIIRTAV